MAGATAIGLALARRRAAPSPGRRRGAAVRPSSAAGRCGVCRRERVQFERSRRAREGVLRLVPWRRRPLDQQGVAHGAGFRAGPGADIRACARLATRRAACAWPAGGPVRVYQTSGHGRRLAQGDLRVAVCSDCHGAHEILAPSDPSSRVFRINLPKTCLGCHADSTRMTRGGKPMGDARTYLSSIHAQELLDRGNPRAPTCVSCHGVHGAAPPGAGDIDKVCGQCHTAERRYFAAGPHLERMVKAGLPECVSCHGNHAIMVSQPQRLATVCEDCHGAGSSQVALGARMWTEYQAASTQIEQAGALVARADAVPIQTEDYRARLEEARTYLREALPAAHAVQEQTVAGLTGRARGIGAEVGSEIHGKLGHLQARKVGLVVFWFYLALTVVVLRILR
jgi:predicted CXXCH cytochrome family protein